MPCDWRIYGWLMAPGYRSSRGVPFARHGYYGNGSEAINAI